MLIAFAVLLVLAAGPIRPSAAAKPQVPILPASLELSANPDPNSNSASPPPVRYDEQIGLTFTRGLASIAYNVTAVAQMDVNGYGPAYLLNGLSNDGYWYQVGLSYNWPYTNGGYNYGFNVNYEVFDSAGTSIFPSDGGGGLIPLTGTVNNGDTVLLNLYFSGGNVIMYVYDWNTGAHAKESYAAHGSSFVGLSRSSDSNGFFTGLMTEWWHVNAYYGSEEGVAYTNMRSPLSSAYLWADEWVPSKGPTQFATQQHVSLGVGSFQSFSKDGATSFADSYTFVTGPSPTANLTLSYSISGGGAGGSAPRLSYYDKGIVTSATLTVSPTAYAADLGSPWRVSRSLTGGSSTERWAAGATGGTVSQSDAADIVYYHQYAVTASYSVVGGGAPSSPILTGTSYGLGVTVMVGPQGSVSWLDAHTSWTAQSILGGSSETERWATASRLSGPVDGAATVSIAYYHQYALIANYSVMGGGTAPTPYLQGSEFGRTLSVGLNSTAAPIFLDAGTSWAFPEVLTGNTSGERWLASQPSNSTMSASATLTISYIHQYNLQVNPGPSTGGSITGATGWYDSGSSVRLSAAANTGWRFEGWAGSGNGSFTGQSSQTSIVVDGPLLENATFYPGLTITASADGAVGYSYGSQSGTVPAGGSTMVFAPVGTKISLTANPSLPIYKLDHWSPQSMGASVGTSVTLDTPAVVQATFGLNLIVVGGIVGTAIVVVVVLTLGLRGRNRKPQ